MLYVDDNLSPETFSMLEMVASFWRCGGVLTMHDFFGTEISLLY